MAIDNNFKIFSKNGRFLIKRKKENNLITYRNKPFTFKTKEEAEEIAIAITTIDKHKIVDLGYSFYEIK